MYIGKGLGMNLLPSNNFACVETEFCYSIRFSFDRFEAMPRDGPISYMQYTSLMREHHGKTFQDSSRADSYRLPFTSAPSTPHAIKMTGSSMAKTRESAMCECLSSGPMATYLKERKTSY